MVATIETGNDYSSGASEFASENQKSSLSWAIPKYFNKLRYIIITCMELTLFQGSVRQVTPYGRIESHVV